MKITEELVDYVSTLSRLRLPREEKAKMAGELEQIVTYMDPLSHTFPLKNVPRADEVVPSADREALLSGAPDRDAETFRVPKAVE